MPNFINGSVGINDDMVAAGQRYGLQHARAQQRWQDQEMRRLVDSDNRRNYALSQATSGTLADSRGVFDDNADLAGLNPSDAPVARATGAGPMSLQASGAGGSAGVDTANTTPVTPLVGGNEPAFDRQRVIGPISLAGLSREERTAVEAYVEAAGGRRSMLGGSPLGLGQGASPRGPDAQALATANRRLRALGLEMRGGRLHRVTGNYSMEALRFPDAGSSATPTPVGDDGLAPDTGYNEPNSADFVPNTEDNGGRGLAPPDADAYEQPFSDASGDIQPTRDMRLIQTARDNALRQAEISAQHGDNAGAQVLFAQALQGEAALFQRTNEILYRNASSGNLAAMSRLLERFHGLPRGTARVQQTDERRPRFFLQRNTARPGERPNWVSITGSTPQTRDQMLGGFLNLVDAAGAAARRETDSEMIRARIGQETDIAVAGIGYQGTRLRVLADAAIAQMDDATRRIAAQGQGRFAPDPEGNGVFYTHPGPDGEPITEFYRVEEQASPDTEGDRTIDVPTATPVSRTTGMPNVGAR